MLVANSLMIEVSGPVCTFQSTRIVWDSEILLFDGCLRALSDPFRVLGQDFRFCPSYLTVTPSCFVCPCMSMSFSDMSSSPHHHVILHSHFQWFMHTHFLNIAANPMIPKSSTPFSWATTSYHSPIGNVHSLKSYTQAADNSTFFH